MHLRQKIEATGILIVINGVVGNNNYRKLDPDEFRGFVLSDEHAPLVFINGADFKAAQMFTIAHEVAHLWINREGVSNFEAMQPPPVRVETWCNEVAAEFLVPATELSQIWTQAKRSDEPYQFLAARFKPVRYCAPCSPRKPTRPIFPCRSRTCRPTWPFASWSKARASRSVQ